MNQWCATVFIWLLLALLILTDYARWAVITAAVAAGLAAVIVIGGGIAGHVLHRRDVRAPASDVAALRPEDCPRCSLPLSTEAFSVICDCPGDCGVPHCKGVFAYISEGDR